VGGRKYYRDTHTHTHIHTYFTPSRVFIKSKRISWTKPQYLYMQIQSLLHSHSVLVWIRMLKHIFSVSRTGMVKLVMSVVNFCDEAMKSFWQLLQCWGRNAFQFTCIVVPTELQCCCTGYSYYGGGGGHGRVIVYRFWQDAHKVHLRSVCSLRYTYQNLFQTCVSDGDEMCNGLYNTSLFGQRFIC
jgi:hypothetical protein